MQFQSQNQESLMGEKTKNQTRGGSISEEDIAVIFQRYAATTVLALLQEVAQVQDVKMDWNALVKQTKTGITNPREYQMLWRHLAYRDALLGKLEDEAEPLDDDSDLEYELEAFPTVSNEASAEAAACVKVLIASGSPSDSCLEKHLTIEAPLTINIPKGKSTLHLSENHELADLMSRANITVPVSVPKQALPSVSSAEGLDTNGCANSNLPARRKRKPWSAAEDMELFAAVQKCGEGNWANILKGDFKGDRTASQLSQRWNIIKKRKSDTNVKTSLQHSEVQLAARRALNMALDKPGVDGPKAATSLGRTNSDNISVQPAVADPLSSAAPTPPQNLSQQDSAPIGAKKPFPRTQQFPTRVSAKPLTTGLDAVKAAAVAAGARIATQSAAAAILKAQLKSAIHIKTTAAGNTRPSPPVPGTHLGSDYLRDLYSNVSPGAQRSNLGPSHANGNVGPVVQVNQSSSATPEMNASSGTSNGLEGKPAGSANSPAEAIREDQVAVTGSKDQEEQTPASSNLPNTNLESG